MRYLTLLLLAGCAGYEAMQWRPRPPKPCPILVCEVRGGDKVCGCATHQDLPRILNP
jgi:hypothetical protein